MYYGCRKILNQNVGDESSAKTVTILKNNELRSINLINFFLLWGSFNGFEDKCDFDGRKSSIRQYSKNQAQVSP